MEIFAGLATVLSSPILLGWILLAAIVGRFILRIPTKVLYPLIFLTAVVAAYASRGSLFDIGVMIAAGFIGWLMKKLHFNPAAFVISFVLAGGAEEALRQSLRMSDDGLLIFVQWPVAFAFIVLGIAAILLRARSLRRQRMEQPLDDA